MTRIASYFWCHDDPPPWAGVLAAAGERLVTLLTVAGSTPGTPHLHTMRLIEKYATHRVFRATAYVWASSELQPAIIALASDLSSSIEPLIFVEDYMAIDLSAPHQMLKVLTPTIGSRRAQAIVHHKWPTDTSLIRGERVRALFARWDKLFRGDRQ